jgi:hypothetical protein
MAGAKILANDGTNWRSTASPVKTADLRAADKALDDAARAGDGPSATLRPRKVSFVALGSEEKNIR